MNTKTTNREAVSVSKKRTRRFLKRVAARKGVEYMKAISAFYGRDVSRINRKTLVELNPSSAAERIL